MSGENDLSHNAIGLWGVIFYSVSVISPAFTFTVGSVASIVYSGLTAPLAFLIAGITNFSAVIALYIFSRHISNSGGYFKFIEAATQNKYISKTVGLWYLSTIVGVMIMGAGIVAWFVNSALDILFGLTLPVYYVIALSMIVPVLYLVMGYFRIESAAKTAITIGLLQIVVFTVFSVAFVLRTHYNSVLYFNIGNSTNGLHGFFLGMVIGAFFSYAGYGAVVSLGEEVRFSRKTMKKAIVFALAIMVAFETFSIYSIVAAAGPSLSLLTNSISPSLFLAKSYFGIYAAFAAFAVALLGIIFSLVLSGNSGARYAFALARDGLLPSSWMRTHKKYKSPYIVIVWTFLFSITGAILTETLMVRFFGDSNGLFYSWAVWGTVLMVFSMLLVVLTNSTLALFLHRIKRKVSVISHIITPSISSAVMIIAMYYSLTGLKNPMTLVYWIVLSITILNLAILYWKRKKMKMSTIDDLIAD